MISVIVISECIMAVSEIGSDHL